MKATPGPVRRTTRCEVVFPRAVRDRNGVHLEGIDYGIRWTRIAYLDVPPNLRRACRKAMLAVLTDDEQPQTFTLSRDGITYTVLSTGFGWAWRCTDNDHDEVELSGVEYPSASAALEAVAVNIEQSIRAPWAKAFAAKARMLAAKEGGR